jgi:hypothetical protein
MEFSRSAPSCVRLVLLSSAALLIASGSVFAAPLKVDISNSGRPLAEGLDPAFTDWATTQNWFTGGNTTSRTFDGVTVTFTRTGPVGTGLKTGYWKTGVQSTTFNVKLSADGLKVDADAAGEALGAQIEMRIAGLSPGAHTLLLYLNNWDAITSVAPLDIFVNGAQVVNDLPVSTQVTDNNNATTAYLNLTAVAGQDLVILIKAETSGSETSKNVRINGFEIDVPNAKAQANNPVPNNADEHADADTGSLTLGWGTAVLGAVSHHVYFGTSESAVSIASVASPEFRGNQSANTYQVSGINTHLTYYWRIDEVSAGGEVTKGNVWYFRPRRLAFPGAEGHGRFARGGRGGVVVKVTNLNDSGPGSLRDAIVGNYGPRTVVFDVSGLITLQNDIIINGNLPYITVAGQTAPGKGICVKRQQFAMSGARDVIFRYVRVLVGKESGETQNATGMAGVDHCIMDHCSLGWGIDEGLSTRGGKNLTFQRCNLSEALNIAGHQNYPAGTKHGYAATIGGEIASFHHNLLAHNEGRNWSMGGGLDAAGYYAGKLDIFNNVVYNWGGRTTDGGAHQVNFVNNYYKTGPASTKFTALNPQYGGFPGTQQYYMAGNVMPGRFTESNQAAGRTVSTENGGTLPENSTPPYSAWVASPFFPSHATIHSARNAYKQVLSDVGCNLPMLDDRDTRIIGETLNGTTTYTGSLSGVKGLPDTTADVGGWENYGNEVRPASWDSDNDGMPNWWETIRSLDINSQPGDYSECNGDPDGDGYTNLEEYLNWMAAPHADCGISVDVDLGALTRGYTSGPVYVLTGAVNGSVSLVGGNKARFTATNPASPALGAFTFTVTDSTGDSMTRTVGIRVLGSGGTPPPAAPTGLAATPVGNQVDLSWTASSGATSYILKRATSSGGPFTHTIATPAGTSHVDAGLAAGTYYYVVSAVGEGGESAASAQASATILPTVPPAPTGLGATAGNAQVSLSWNASSGATSYHVKRATANGGPYATVASPSGTAWINSGLINGTTYYFVVSAVNSGGESNNSSQIVATPVAGSLGTPVTIQAEASTFGGGVAIESNNAGFNGTGFANFPLTGGYTQFNNIDGGAGGAATLKVRYALGGTNPSRTGILLINGVSSAITFMNTGAWTTWATLTLDIALASGSANTIRFESTGTDLGNIDEITVTASAAVPPVLSITATDSSAGEFGNDQSLGFTVTRSGSTTSDLTVPLVASGTATAGSDYSGFTGSLMLPAGHTSVTMPLVVLPDDLAEGPETVTITLGASADFTAGSPAAASGSIADRPSQAYFFSAIADPALRGPLDDADTDSNANIIEYFMGSHPGDSSSRGLLTIPSVESATFKIRYSRTKSREDVSGSLRWSSNMVDWFASGQSDGTHTVSFTEAVVSDPSADPETVEATATITGADGFPKIFIRLQVAQIEEPK